VSQRYIPFISNRHVLIRRRLTKGISEVKSSTVIIPETLKPVIASCLIKTPEKQVYWPKLVISISVSARKCWEVSVPRSRR